LALQVELGTAFMQLARAHIQLKILES